MKKTFICLMLCMMIATSILSAKDAYKNFDTAIYTRVYEVQKMADDKYLKENFDIIQKNMHVDKIYLETHRDMVVAKQETITKLKKFFKKRGVQTAGGITITVNERNRFETYCYSNPEHRQKLKEVVEFTAKNFDQVILDDFFFTSCKCEKCIAAKGEQSWTDFRLKLMTDAAKELILEPARKVNPDVEVIIKYPNWYDHFQGLGFNLKEEPPIFDGVYTGTETRDPSSNQHLQAYLSYLIFRYFEHLKPGANLGGWVDTGGMRYVDRYAEQIWLTLFAKAPEQTLFDFRQLINPLNPNLRAAWQDEKPSYNFDEMIKPALKDDGSWDKELAKISLAAGYTFERIDPVIGALGNPVGVKSYKPFHSAGEDFLQNYFGMIGIPMDLVPEFPENEKMVILTEQASADPKIIEKIKKQLINGGNIMVTSGFLRVMENNGLSDIAELRYTDRKAIVKDFKAGWGPSIPAKTEMLIPQINYYTNDSWEEISAMDETNGWPILHSAQYGNGYLYVLTIPESFTDLYNLPESVLNRIRQTASPDMPLRLNGPAEISLFVYDNNTFIVHSFLDETADIQFIVNEKDVKLKDVETGETLTGEPVVGFWNRSTGEHQFKLSIKPHSFRVFKMQ